MTKKQTTIRKIIAAITIVSLLAILAIYAFSSSEKNEDANQNDPQKKIQNGDDKDNIQKDNPPEAHKAGNDGWLSRREAVLGGFLGVALYIWYYSAHLIDIDSGIELWQDLCGGVNMFYTAGCWVIASALGLVAVKLVGYLIARYINKELRQSVINALILLAPSAILLQIGRLIRQKKVNNFSGSLDAEKQAQLAALNKTLMLMSVGVLVGVAIGALTFTVVSYLKYYEEVDTADSMGQFLPKLNPALHGQEMRCLGVLSLITALVSSKAWEHDVWSWETAAILGAIIVGALLTIQIVHTLGSKLPGKCTLLGALAWLFIYSLSVLLNKAPDTWWDWKNIGSSLAMLFMGYVFDACGKPWVDWLEGRKVFLTNININIFIVNLGLVVLATLLILFTNGENTWGIMHSVILITVIAAVVYIGYYSYDAYAMAESVSSFRKDHGGKRLAQLAASIVVSSAAVAWATWYISGSNEWNKNRSLFTNRKLANTSNMALMGSKKEHGLALVGSVVTYGAIGMFTGYYDPYPLHGLKSSLLFITSFMLSELGILALYYRKKYQAKQLLQLHQTINKLNKNIQNNAIITRLIYLSSLDDANILLSEEIKNKNKMIWAEKLLDHLEDKNISNAIKNKKVMKNKLNKLKVNLAELALSKQATELANMNNNTSLNINQLKVIIGKLTKWLILSQNVTIWKEAAGRYIVPSDPTYAKYINDRLNEIVNLDTYKNNNQNNLKDKIVNLQNTLKSLSQDK